MLQKFLTEISLLVRISILFSFLSLLSIDLLMQRRRELKLFYLIVAQLLLFSIISQEVSATVVEANQLKETSVSYNKKREKVFCFGNLPGSISTRSSRINFTTFSSSLAKTSRSSRSKYDRLKALVSLGSRACKKISTVTPGSSPTPAPTSTPEPTGNFDLQGNVTPAGKILFGIPSSLVANVTAGKSVQTAKCSGCHTEKTGRTFLYLRSSIQRSPMLFDEGQIPDPMLANLVAYLNRFRP